MAFATVAFNVRLSLSQIGVSAPRLKTGFDLKLTLILSLFLQPEALLASTQYRPGVVAIKVGEAEPSCQTKVFVLPAPDGFSNTLVPPQTVVSAPRLILIASVVSCLLIVSVPQLVNFMSWTV